jgi:hypothetical protein
LNGANREDCKLGVDALGHFAETDRVHQQRLYVHLP